MSTNTFAVLTSADDGFTEVKSKFKKDQKAAPKKDGAAAPAAPKDRNTKGGRSKGANPTGNGNRPPKRQFDRHVSGTGRYRGEKKGGNTKGGSGEKSVTADQVPADVVVEEVVVEEPKVVEPEEPRAFVLEDFEKSKVKVADDKKAARAPVATATGSNISTKAPATERVVVTRVPGQKQVNASKKVFNIAEFLAVGGAAPAAPTSAPAPRPQQGNKKGGDNKKVRVSKNDFPSL